jgi:hypothetical protein
VRCVADVVRTGSNKQKIKRGVTITW